MEEEFQRRWSVCCHCAPYLVDGDDALGVGDDERLAQRLHVVPHGAGLGVQPPPR